MCLGAELDEERSGRAERSAPGRVGALVVGATLLVGLALRAWGLTAQSFTSDEITDLADARQPASIGGLLNGGKRFPPLYYLVLRLTFAVFRSDIAARWLSVGLGLLTVVAIWRFARHVAGRRAGLTAAAFAAFAPFQVWYSQETRPYGLFVFFGALTLLAFARLRATATPCNWALYVAASVSGLFTHYYFGVLVALTVAILLLDGTVGRAVRPALAALGAMGVVAVPWVLLLSQDLRGKWGDSAASEFGLQGLAYTLFSFVSGYTLGPSQRELHSLSLGEALTEYGPWFVLIAPAMLVMVLAGYQALRGSRWPATLAVLALGPVALIGGVSYFAPFGFNVRHIAWSFIPIAVWVGAGIAQWRTTRLVIPAVIVLLAVFSIALSNRVSDDRYRNEDSEAVATYLESVSDEGVVYVSASYMANAIDHYLDDDWTVYGVGHVSADGDGLSAAVEGIGEGVPGQRTWFAYTRPFHSDPAGVLVEELLGSGARLEASFAGIELYSIPAL